MATILVTGASGGIGGAIVSSLKEAGHTVVAISHSDADLTSYSAVEQLKEKVAASGPLDWVVCSHGFLDDSTSIDDESPEDMQKTFAVNTFSLFYIAKLFTPMLSKNGGMVFISSTAGLQANGRVASYSASKAAVNSLAQALARNKPDYTFFSVCPGPTNTPMRERTAHDAATKQSPSVVADMVRALVEGTGDYRSGDVVVVKDTTVSIASRLS